MSNIFQLVAQGAKIDTGLGCILFLSLSLVGCAGAQTGKEVPDQLGEFAIGSSPKDLGVFSTTDCVGAAIDLSDCSGVGLDGIRYVFFDGALSRVSVNRTEAKGTVKLPGDLIFGESVTVAAAKMKGLGVDLDRNEVNGRVIYSSSFVIKSSAGIDYSIEIHADEHGELFEIIERTDF